MAADATATISLHEAADRLGVHYMTVYRYIRLGRLPAHKVGGSWRVDPSDLELVRAREPTMRPIAQAGSTGSTGRRRAPWADRLRQRLVVGDTEGSWQVVEAAMASGLGPADIHVDVLGPALHEIGGLWRTGALGIEQEHLATGVAAAIVGRMGPRFRRRGRPHGTVLVAMPIGERHGLGVAMLADILRGDGFSVLNLGPDTPPDSLVAAMRRADAFSAVIVSVVDSSHLAAAADLASAARQCDEGVVVIAGGFAVPDERVARSIGADGWSRDPRRLGELIDALRAGR
jgi:excisionase family DNA binding protein